MTKTILSLAFAATLATASNAGSLADPIVEDTMIAADTAATSSGNGVGLLLFLTAVIVAAATD